MRGQPVDLKGRQFGRLTAVAPTAGRKRGYEVWQCSCECGGTKLVASHHLVNSNVRSCGCMGRPERTYRGARACLHCGDTRRYVNANGTISSCVTCTSELITQRRAGTNEAWVAARKVARTAAREAAEAAAMAEDMTHITGAYWVRMICEMRKQGDTLKVIGLRFRRTRECIRQIVANQERQERARRKFAAMGLEQSLVK
jgi:hypothetical protein